MGWEDPVRTTWVVARPGGVEEDGILRTPRGLIKNLLWPNQVDMVSVCGTTRINLDTESQAEIVHGW